MMLTEEYTFAKYRLKIKISIKYRHRFHIYVNKVTDREKLMTRQYKKISSSSTYLFHWLQKAIWRISEYNIVNFSGTLEKNHESSRKKEKNSKVFLSLCKVMKKISDIKCIFSDIFKWYCLSLIIFISYFFPSSFCVHNIFISVIHSTMMLTFIFQGQPCSCNLSLYSLLYFITTFILNLILIQVKS